jgi:hypothetical protein
MTREMEVKWHDLTQVPDNTNLFSGKEKNRNLQDLKYN